LNFIINDGFFKNLKIKKMKKILKICFSALCIAAVIWGCKKSEDLVDPSIDASGIVNSDIVQLTNANPNLVVNYSASDDKQLDSVRVSVVEKGTINIAAFGSKKNIAGAADQGTISIPFPAPAGSKSGLYTVVIIGIDKNGNTARKSYDISVLDNRTGNGIADLPIPAGKNVMVKVSVPEGLVNDNEGIWITGDFESANGGNNWSGGDNGNSIFKLTRINSTSYYIFLNFVNDNVFKFTRGSWGQVIKDGDRQEIADYRYVNTFPNDINFNYTTGQYINVRIFNWADRKVTNSHPYPIPAASIGSGKLTVVVNVNNRDDAKKYFLVKKGGNLSDQSIPMTRIKDFQGFPTTRFTAAVPRDANTTYLVVRDNPSQIGINVFGYEQEIKWDGEHNPVFLNLDRYKNQGVDFPATNQLFITGEATPGGWDTSPQSYLNNPERKFISLGNGKFVINKIALEGDKKYLLSPGNGNGEWDWGRFMGFGNDGDPNYGSVIRFRDGGGYLLGSDLTTPKARGNFKIEVDFYTGSYKLTRL
jgi:hypothetical protein